MKKISLLIFLITISCGSSNTSSSDENCSNNLCDEDQSANPEQDNLIFNEISLNLQKFDSMSQEKLLEGLENYNENKSYHFLLELIHQLIQEHTELRQKLLNGEKVELSNLSGENKTPEESIVMSLESLKWLEENINQESLNESSLQKSALTDLNFKRFQNPLYVCHATKEFLDVLEPAVNISGNFCGLGNQLACGALAYTNTILRAVSMVKTVCNLLPTKMEKVELYPEDYCLFGINERYPDGDQMNVLVEATLYNEVSAETVVRNIIDEAIDFSFSYVERVFSKSNNNLNESQKVQKESILDRIKNFLKDGTYKIADLIAEKNNYSLTDTLFEWEWAFALYPVDYKALRRVKRSASGADQLLFFENGSLQSTEFGGLEVIQVKVDDWPFNPEEIFESSERGIQISHPPYLQDFSMPDRIPNYNFEADEDPLRNEWGDGRIFISDPDRDLFYMDFVVNPIEDENYWHVSQLPSLESTFNSEITGIFHELDFRYTSSHNNNLLNTHIMSSGAGVMNAGYEMNARQAQAGSITLNVLARDICGNISLLQPFEISWGNPHCEIREPCRNEINRRDNLCYNRNEGICDVPEGEVDQSGTCIQSNNSGNDRLYNIFADYCYMLPNEAFQDYPDLPNDHLGLPYESRWTLNPDETYGPFHQSWENILRIRDELPIEERGIYMTGPWDEL